jgi:hypothetical protein
LFTASVWLQHADSNYYLPMITPEKKVLVIAGMHRSGTSLITQWLYKCGLHVGDNLMEPSFANVQGYFEDLDFVTAHENILQEEKLKTSGLVVCNNIDIKEKNIKHLKNIISKKSSEHNEWGWKDPRTCLFLDTYAALIPGAYYLVIIRDFEETISSLISRHYKGSVKKYQHKKGFSKWLWENYKKKRRMHLLCRKYATYYLKVWILYNENLLKHLQTLPPNRFMVVHSSLLKENDAEIFSHFTDEWNFSLHYYPFNNVFKSNLWSNKIDTLSYIKDKELLSHAYTLMKKLQTYSTITDTVPLEN